jgi:hypothetical protein
MILRALAAQGLPSKKARHVAGPVAARYFSLLLSIL